MFDAVEIFLQGQDTLLIVLYVEISDGTRRTSAPVENQLQLQSIRNTRAGTRPPRVLRGVGTVDGGIPLNPLGPRIPDIVEVRSHRKY